MSEIDRQHTAPDHDPEAEYERKICEYRQAVDEINADIVGLVNRRVKVAVAIGQLKLAHGKPIFVDAREQEVIAKVTAANETHGAHATNEDIAALFSVLMQMGRQAQQKQFDSAEGNAPA